MMCIIIPGKDQMRAGEWRANSRMGEISWLNSFLGELHPRPHSRFMPKGKYGRPTQNQ